MAHGPFSIAHVTAEHGFSGGEVQVFLLAETLRQRGHRCGFVCPRGSRSAAEATRRGFDLATVPPLRDWSPASVARTATALRRLEPDLAHLHSHRAAWIGGLAALPLGLPVLATRRMDRPRNRSWRTRFVYGYTAHLAVAISHPVAQQLAASGVSETEIRVVPSAIDPARLVARQSREATRAALGVREGETCLLSVASLHRRKGLDLLLDATHRLNGRGIRTKVWIAGSGPERDALETQVQSLGLGSQVALLGQRDDVADLLNACDAFVLASRQEGLGVAALEAMALGRPVAASRVGGLADAVGDEIAGLLFPAEDADALADVLQRLATDAALRVRLGSEGRERGAKNHSASAMVTAYENLYAQVLS